MNKFEIKISGIMVYEIAIVWGFVGIPTLYVLFRLGIGKNQWNEPGLTTFFGSAILGGIFLTTIIILTDYLLGNRIKYDGNNFTIGWITKKVFHKSEIREIRPTFWTKPPVKKIFLVDGASCRFILPPWLYGIQNKKDFMEIVERRFQKKHRKHIMNSESHHMNG